MKFREWYLAESNKKYRYIGQCDRLRKCGNEQNWQNMVAQAKPVTMQQFLDEVDMFPLLDEGESVEDFFAGFSKVEFYFSAWGDQKCYFYKTRDFEFIFLP